MTQAPVDDVLSAVLAAYQVRATVTDRVEKCGNWQFREPRTTSAYFHLIESGQCSMRFRTVDAPVSLSAGDLVVLPHGSYHTLDSVSRAKKGPGSEKKGSGSNSGENSSLAPFSPGENASLAPFSFSDCAVEGGEYTTMICGEVEFTRGQGNPLLSALPELIVVRDQEGGKRFHHVAAMLREECQAHDLGSRAVVDKLADALFVMAVRHYIAHAPNHRGLFAALLDSRLAKALAAVHTDPAQDWTVESLATVAAMSRTAFAGRFAEVLGESPIQYLTHWRMNQAEKLLQNPRLSVAAVAEQVGYQTEAAFRRSFKRYHGHGPGRVRKAAARAGAGKSGSESISAPEQKNRGKNRGQSRFL